jgi:hypothetical protein
MFNLEQSIAEWRRQMMADGVKPPMPLNELESHLREDVRALMSAGKPEDQAFQLAVSRLGNPGQLRTEFKKLKKPACWPVTLGSWLFAGGMLLMAAGLSKGISAGKLSPLLYIHILAVTVGYGAAFMAGAFGIFYVCCRLFRALSPNRQQSLGRAVVLFSQISAGLTVVGTALAMLWNHQHLGIYLQGDPKELGAACVIIWFLALSVMQRRGRLSERATMLMCIVGNIIVSLAWFGAGILDSNQKMHAQGTAGYWPLALAIFVGLNLLFLVIGLAPGPEEGPS